MLNGINFQQLTAGIVFLIMLMVGVMQAFTSFTVIRVAYNVQSELNGFERMGEAKSTLMGLEIKGIDDGGRKKYGYVAMARIGEFHDFRSVHVSDTLRVKDLVDAGRIHARSRTARGLCRGAGVADR